MKICRTCKEEDKEYYKHEQTQCIDCMIKLSTKQRIKKKYLIDNITDIFLIFSNLNKAKSPTVIWCIVKDIKKFVKRVHEHFEAEYEKKMKDKLN